jgi:hypothetical protein
VTTPVVASKVINGGWFVNVRSASPHLLDQVSLAVSGSSSLSIVKVLVSAVQKGLEAPVGVAPTIGFQIFDAHSATIATEYEVVLVGYPDRD